MPFKDIPREILDDATGEIKKNDIEEKSVMVSGLVPLSVEIDGKPISVDSASITEGKLVFHFLKAQEFPQFFPLLRCDFSACYRSFEFIQFFR